MAGTNGDAGGTSGGTASAAWRLDRTDRIALVSVLIVTAVIAGVNAATVADDYAGVGQPLDPWEPWVWELTSAAFWIAIAVPLLRLLRRLRPPHRGWAVAVAAVLLLSLPVCAAHVGWLAVSRHAVYAALGAHYDYDFSVGQLVYEWRKDLLSLLLFAVTGWVVDRLAAAPPAPVTDTAAPPFRLEVRDGARTRWFAATDIERVEAAGNYVELHTSAGAVLHRATLAAVAEQLGPHGFARIHRSRLVRRAAITAIATTASGDFEATLASGATIAGSRRFRDAVA